MIAGICIAILVNKVTSDSRIDPETAFIVVSACVVIMPISIHRLLKKQKAALDSFVLTIDDSSVNAATSTGEVTMSYIEIKRNTEGGLVITSGLNNTMIVIPPEMENKEQMETRLHAISPFMTSGKSLVISRYGTVIVITYFILFFTFITSRQQLVNIITGPIVVAGTALAFRAMHKNKNLPQKIRWIKWLLLFMTIAFAYKCIAFAFQINWVYFPIRQ